MQPEFWLERWQNNEIGFHLPTVNPLLVEHWPQLHLPAGTRVLVPLAGKTVDLSWLRAQGHAVVAVELSEDAARAFYAEAGLAPTRVKDGAFIRYHADAIDYLVGDFFSLDAVTLGEFGAVWDRGALVALPPPMRARYAAHLIQLSAATTRTLLITLEYAQSQMKGPPFAVPETEVHALFAASHEIALLLREDILDLEPRFRDRGVSALHSVVYALSRRESPQS